MALPPGPRSPRVAQTAEWVFRPTTFMERCAREFGDTFTLRMTKPVGDVVFTSDPEAIGSVLAAGAPRHMRPRRVTLPPFNGERIDRNAELIAEIASRSLQSWPRRAPFSLYPKLREMTLDAVLRVAFGIEEDRLRSWRMAFTDPPKMIRSRAGFAALTRGHWRAGSPNKAFARRQHRARGLLEDEIATRRKDGHLLRGADFMSLLLAADHQDGHKLSDAEIRDELMSVLIAGHDIAAAGLAWAFERLFRNPPAMDRLTVEVRDGGPANHDAYLGAVVTETLRLGPIAHTSTTTLAAPLRLNGYTIPRGARVNPCIYLTHRRADIYPDPEAFKPERFLSRPPRANTWIPFGGGARHCIGASFAQLEMKEVLRTVLGRARLRPARPEPESPIRRGLVSVPKHGAMAVVEQLNRASYGTTPSYTHFDAPVRIHRTTDRGGGRGRRHRRAGR